MATRTKQAGPQLGTYKLAAIIAQLASFGATWLFIGALGLAGLEGFAVAVVVEALLMKGKQLVFSGAEKGPAMGWISIIIDTVLNAAGMFPYVLRFDETSIWPLFTLGLGFTGTMDGVPAFIVAGALGFFLAIAPHQLWRD